MFISRPKINDREIWVLVIIRSCFIALVSFLNDLRSPTAIFATDPARKQTTPVHNSYDAMLLFLGYN